MIHHLSTIEDEEIAIIGMSGRFPGARNVQELWENLSSGKESITFLSDEELKASGTSDADLNNPYYIKAAALLDDVDRFDADFFGITPREAIAMDPQHRFFLECAYEALIDGGYKPGKEPLNIGVFGGAGSTIASYLLEYIKAHPDIQGLSANHHAWGIDKDYFTTRTSYKLNLTGPSFDVQTGCSSSLVAVHLACEAIQRGHCPLALAGGVSIRVPHQRGYYFSEGDVHSRDGHCRTFDAESSGTVFGSGVGIVLLKKLSEAIKDNDRIYAVIKGTFINNDGSDKSSYPSPGHRGQFECISQGFSRAGINPESIQFMEAHGTGTIVGDPIEVQSLSKAFNSKSKGYCAIGSLKPNIGHLGAASGVASLIKLALSLFYKKIPAHINYKEPNPLIDFGSTPFYVNTETKEWTKESGPRRGAINSFGVGGTNAFAILEEANSSTKPPLCHPFNGKSYWVELPQPNHHPLLGWKVDVSIISDDLLYENVLKADSYLKDHKIVNHILFPGAGFVEMLVEAAKSAGCHLPLQITSFEIKQALEIKKDVRIQTKIKKTDAGHEVTIYSFDESWKPHVIAIVGPAQQEKWLDIPSFSGNMDKHYKRVEELGYYYGPHFRAVQPDGRLKTEDNTKAYTVYPPLLDGAFQLSIGSSLTIPTAIEKIVVFEPFPREIKVRLDGSNYGLYDLSDKCLLRVKNLQRKVIDKDTFSKLLDKGVNHLLYHEHWQKSVLDKKTSQTDGKWLLVYSELTPLVEKLKQKLPGCEILHADDIPNMVQGYNVVNLLTYQGRAFSKTVALLQAFLKVPDQNALFFSLTKGISPLKGLQRTLKQEFLHSRLIHIHVEDEEALIEELLYPDLEPEILLREEGRYVNRIVAHQEMTQSHQYLPVPGKNHFLSKGSKLDELAWKADESPALKEDEIEVEVKASALNFRDVLNALSLYPGESGRLGSDFSGIIKNKGSNVKWKIGEEVFGIASGSLQNSLITKQSLVAKKPEHLSFIEAASIPIVFLTTYYALIHLAKLKKDDKILIHAAAGGVGLAAIQIAQSVGAEIYATAGSKRKRDYLKQLGISHIFDSRSHDYTAIKDINVVLNSLTGTGFIESSLNTLAHGGCFLELSKRNIWTPEEMKKARPDVHYFIVALDEMKKNNPEKIQSLLHEIKDVSPLPQTIFPLTQIKSAFHYLQEAKQIGKIIVKFPTSWRDNLSHGTYLITGGVGGIGLKIAEWLLSQGARKILLVSRKIPPALKLPPEITVQSCDITDENQVNALFKQPIKGIIHAAGILHNAGFLDHTPDDFEQVLAPKVKGAQVLHDAIVRQKIDLDFVVYLSSTSALLGGHGRSAYAAANSFLDEFAKFQQSFGIPAVSIAFGAWEEVGMALPHLKQMQRRGIQGLKTKEALSSIQFALDNQDSYLAVTATDWDVYISSIAKDNPRFKLLSQKTSKTSSHSNLDLHEHLAQMIRTILGQPHDYPIDIDEPFINQKLDSLNQIEFLAEMEKHLKLKQVLRANILQKYPSIRSLSAHLQQDFIKEEKWLPLGTNMEHYWHNQFSKDFNIGRSVLFNETVHAANLEKAFNEVVKRHSIFHMAISSKSPVYKITPHTEFKLEFSQTAANYNQLIDEPIKTFPKIRGILCNDRELQIICPHSISDGRVLHLFLKELDDCYTQLQKGKSVFAAPKANDYQLKFPQYDAIINENKEQKDSLAPEYIPFRLSKVKDLYEPPLKLKYSLSYRQQFQEACQKMGIESSLAFNGLAGLALSFITKQTDFSVVYASDGIFSPHFAEVMGPFCKQIPLSLSRKKSDSLEDYVNRVKEKQALWSYLKEFSFSQLPLCLPPVKKRNILSFLQKIKLPLLLGVTEIELKDFCNFSSVHRSSILDRMKDNKDVVNVLSVLIQDEWNIYIAWPHHAKLQKTLHDQLDRLISHFMKDVTQKLTALSR